MSGATRIWRPEEVGEAARALRNGELVAFPTETVYGLGGDATNDAAVAAIYAAKQRPRFNPLILHVPNPWAAFRLIDAPPGAEKLAKRFWPGPLTLVARLKEGVSVSPLVRAGLSTVAVRVPAQPLAQQLLSAVGRPVAAPSANISGRISPTRPAHVLSTLSGRIAGVLDGGSCPVGLESTIIGFEGGAPRLLRAGGVSAEEIEEALGAPLAGLDNSDTVTAPGQLASHYAPNARVRLNASSAEAGETLLGFGDAPGAAINLSPSGDLLEAAAKLFAALHELDQTADAIAVSPVPEVGLGRAINDRLRRAAAPRGSMEKA